MGITERKERDKVEMRQRIMSAAVQMFLEEGYEKTSIRNIAEKIEYSPATIYLYYKDKDELLYDVQGQAFEKLDQAFREKATSKDPIKRLEQIMLTYVRFGKNNPELYDLMFIIRAPMNVMKEKELWDNGHDSFGFLVQCISDCIEKKLIRYDDVMIAALSVWSMGHGLVSLDLRCRFKVMDMDEDSIAAAIEKSVQEYLKLIKN
ncbi:MAG TPA: TetR/AcrR family transcriptional regulator [Puia sp.]|jgi:AcrR family transcriptional regulator|nr:TetR/AcrR family transcriptional regulator [Puia sp.]